jgi:phosphate:Na+ symporter
LFNTFGVLLWVAFIPLLADVVESLGGGVARQIANAHTIFNVVNTIVFIGFTSQFAALATKLVPDRPDAPVVQPRYLDTDLLRTPSLALDRARLEMLRLAERVRQMLEASVPAVIKGSASELVTIEAMDDEVESLYGSIVEYLGRLSKEELGGSDSDELFQLMEATNNLEAIGDIIETNLVQLGLSRIEQDIYVSPETNALIEQFHDEVRSAFELAMLAVTQKNEGAARRVSAMKGTISSMARKAEIYEATRLVADEPNRVATYAFETDLITHLKRIYWFTRRTARAAVPAKERAEA